MAASVAPEVAPSELGASAKPENELPPIGGKTKRNVPDSLVANGGKSLVANGAPPEAKLVAKIDLPPTADVSDLFAKVGHIKESGQVATKIQKGWRLEKKGDYWRWRWQRKDARGKSLTYITKSGKTGYKRGSQYVGKIKPKATK